MALTQEYARKLFDEKSPIGEHVVLQNAVEATVTGVLAPPPDPSHMGHAMPSARLRFDALLSMDVREAVLATTMPPEFRKLRAENWFLASGATYVLLPERGLSARALTSQLDGFVQRLLLTSFSKPVIVANVLAWPLGLVGARMYLKQFQDPIPITPMPFVASLVVAVGIAWLAVASQTWRAARLKPADVLRHE